MTFFQSLCMILGAIVLIFFAVIMVMVVIGFFIFISQPHGEIQHYDSEEEGYDLELEDEDD